MKRSTCIALAASLFALGSGAALAQKLPEGTVKLIVPYAPGGPIDLLTRILADRLPGRLGRTVIVENRPGAGGNIAARMVASAPGDGLTLLAAGDTTFTVNPHVYPNLPFDPERDFKSVTLMGTYTLVLATHPRLPVKTLKELVDYSQTKSLNFASGGNGAPGHLGFEYLRLTTGIKGTHVPYKGGAPAAAALLGGEVDAAFLSTSVVTPQVKSGRTNAIALADLKRYAGLPTTPTIAESGYPGFQIVFSYMMLAPAATSNATVEMLNKEVRGILESDEVTQRLAGVGIEVKTTTPTEAQNWLKAEKNRWQKVVKASDMKVE